MAKGTSSYMGLAVGLSGEHEVTQTTAATDILTITGATSQTGDFLVCQNSTGGENLVVSSSGLVTSVVGMAMTSAAFSGEATATLSSSAAAAGFHVLLTATGAVAAGAIADNAFLVTASSKSNANAAYAYLNRATSGDDVGVTNYLLACLGSKAPDYLLGVGATSVGQAGATTNGFVEAPLFLTAAIATTMPMVGLRVKFGDSVFYVMCITQCGLSA
jgi:hypothetical protein